ncbi:MAG: hypothetical protein M1830_002423 [Pleopsidium flavum]|nr:MAG: hypothetical protein M1830_002423 [Pleopsidium flavum]
MCIALISTAHPEYPLILIDNRDEYLNRPTAPASWWPCPNDDVLGGRDLLRAVHGTWLGITKFGRIAVLTNFREEGQITEGARSRGEMVKVFLTTSPDIEESTENFVKKLIEGEGVKGVGGFSLVCGEIGEPLAVVSNRTPDVDGVTWIAKTKGETVGLSNAAYGDRSWPKVTHGEKLMEKAISESAESNEGKNNFIDRLLEVLSTDTLPKREGKQVWESYVRQLRNSIFVPAIGGEGMDGMSADTVAAANRDTKAEVVEHLDMTRQKLGTSGVYGTQKQTVVLVDHGGQVTLVERTLYDDKGYSIPVGQGDRRFEFQLPKSDLYTSVH